MAKKSSASNVRNATHGKFASELQELHEKFVRRCGEIKLVSAPFAPTSLSQSGVLMSITTTPLGKSEGFFAAIVIEVSGISKTIPILSSVQQVTSNYIKALNHVIESDGCTGVKDYYKDCCIIHDLGYRWHIDPWGRKVTRAQVDEAFRLCIQSRSKLGKFSPVSWARWSAVRLIGRFFYTKDN